jgi:hypothetical protein
MSILLWNCPTVSPKFEFTTEPTAIERQIIGEDKELEKDGWLISSIKTSSTGNEYLKREAIIYKEIGFKDKDYEEILKTLFYLAPEIQKYKEVGIIGEGLNGLLHILKTDLAKYKITPERLSKVVQLTNDSRVRIYETKLLSASKRIKDETELNNLKNKYLLENYYLAEKNEIIEVTKGKWSKK